VGSIEPLFYFQPVRLQFSKNLTVSLCSIIGKHCRKKCRKHNFVILYTIQKNGSGSLVPTLDHWSPPVGSNGPGMGTIEPYTNSDTGAVEKIFIDSLG